MVQDPDIHQGQGIRKAPRQAPVRVRGFRHAGGVVVGEDQRRRVVLECGAHHFPRRHAGAVDGAAEQLFESDDPVPVVRLCVFSPLAQTPGVPACHWKQGVMTGVSCRPWVPAPTETARSL